MTARGAFSAVYGAARSPKRFARAPLFRPGGLRCSPDASRLVTSCHKAWNASITRRNHRHIAVLRTNEHVGSRQTRHREGHLPSNQAARTQHQAMPVPQKKGATPTLLARRLGMGRGSSVLAERPENNACVRGQNNVPTRRRELRRLRGLVRNIDEDVPERFCFGCQHHRQPLPRRARDDEASDFAPLAHEGVCALPRSFISGG
jgi:hypothetical protein